MAEPIAALFTEGERHLKATSLAEIQEALRRLDRLLEEAIRQAESLYGAGAAADPYRGLRTSLEEVEGLLSRVPGEPTLWHGERYGETAYHPSDSITPLAWLAHTFDLSPFDVDVILNRPGARV
jgi:hypothetical protein